MTPSVTDATLAPLLGELSRARGKLAGPASIAVVERTLEACEMPPLHVHEEPEGLHVLEGSLLVVLGDETVRLGAGEALVAPGSVPHTYTADSQPARYVAVSFVRSVGHDESFIRAVARPEPSATPHEGDRVVATIAAENRITVLGPPPGALPGAALAA